MGLLDLNWDALNSDQGRMALGLLAAAGPQERPMSFGQRLAGAMDQFRSQKAAEDERKLKAQVMQAQLEDIKEQALQRNAAAQQLLEGQRALSDVLGNPGAVNQYDTPGSGLSLGGVREQMTPRAAGLAGATPEQIARLKANKIDVESLWQHAKTGLEIKPGSFYKNPTTGQVRYQADPTKGVSFDGERVSLTPGALEAQSALADATKTAEARASAKYQPMYSEGPGGKTLLGSTADVLDGQRPKPAQPIESRVRDMMALFGDKSAQYDIGGQRGSIGDSGPGLKVGPSQRETAAGGALDLGNKTFMDKQYPAVIDAGEAANKSLAAIQTSRQALKWLGSSGWGTGGVAFGASVLGAIGVPQAEKFAGNAQIFQQSAMDRLWTNLNAAKGPQTEGDADRSLQTYATLKNTPRANEFILDLAQATAERDAKRAAYFREAFPFAQQSGDLQEIDRRWQRIEPSVWSMPIMQKWKK